MSGSAARLLETVAEHVLMRVGQGGRGGTIVDPATGVPASLCVHLQLAGILALNSESGSHRTIAEDIVSYVLRNRSDDALFPLIYNQAAVGPDVWDLAELGAAAPSLLVLARAGVKGSVELLRAAAEFCMGRRGAVAGAFAKNSATVGIDVLNGNAYAAAVLASAGEALKDLSYFAEVSDAADHLTSRFGRHRENSWAYSESDSGEPILRSSVAYQATIVGLGRWFAPVVAREDGWVECIGQAAEAAWRDYRSGDRPASESPSWSREWESIPEIAWMIRECEGLEAALEYVGRVLRDYASGALPVKPARDPANVPLSTPLRVLGNCANALIVLTTSVSWPEDGRRSTLERSRTLAEEYVRVHADGTSRPVGSRWAVSGDADTLVVEFPNRVILDLAKYENILRSDSPQDQSMLSWLHSLGYIPTLESVVGPSSVDSLLDTYADFMSTGVSSKVYDRMTSLDHAVAVRLRAICTLAAIRAADGRVLPPAALEIVRRSVEWARRDDRMRPSMHGMVLAVALMHVGYVWPWLLSRNSLRVAVKYAEGAIRAVFDDSSVRAENVPSNTLFYLTVARGIVKLFGESGVPYVDELVATCESVLQRGEGR